MGSTLSKSDGCIQFWCGGEDDACADGEGPPEAEVERLNNFATTPLIESLKLELEQMELEALARPRQQPPSPAYSTHKSSYPAHRTAPPTNEELHASGPVLPFGGPLSRSIDGDTEKRRFGSAGSESWTATPITDEFISPIVGSGHNSLMRESPASEVEEVAVEGRSSFFHSGEDELVKDMSWSHTKRGPSLAELLQRVEFLGNVDTALSEVRGLQDEEDQVEAIMRKKVLKRFMHVMGPDAPGLTVQKCHRSSRGGQSGTERGKWAPRTIHFEPDGAEELPDGTPLGGVITWNSKRLFPREQPGVCVADIAKVEHNGKFLWMTTDGEGKLGFQTSSASDAKFLCRSIDFLVSALVHHTNATGRSRSSTKTSSFRSTAGTNQYVYAAPASDGFPSDA